MKPQQRQDSAPPLTASTLRTGGAILLMLALAACGGSGGDDETPSPDVPGTPGTRPDVPGPTPNVPGPGGPAFQEVACKDYDFKEVMVKPKTITIHNAANTAIYPVLATSMNEKNEWLQGCFRDSSNAYPTHEVYKLYVNEGTGLPPNASVTITLPLYSTLPGGRHITWWNGGRVVLADKNERLRDNKDVSLPFPADVTCEGKNSQCALTVYSSSDQIPESIYAQLSEYTFGDSVEVASQGNSRLLKPDNVGYNISYVDHVYMPVAIGPKNNPYIGYSGSTQSLTAFRDNMFRFLDDANSPGLGWPVYNMHMGGEAKQLRLPGGYNIFALRGGFLPAEDDVPVRPDKQNPPVLTVLSCLQGECTTDAEKAVRFGESVQRIQNLWGKCVDWGAEDISEFTTDAFVACPQDIKDRLTVVKQFFAANYKTYTDNFSKWSCNADHKAKFDYPTVLKHIYGWVPFNEGCNAGLNALSHTVVDAGPDGTSWNHARIQSMYIHDLQYNHNQDSVKKNPDLMFNPYVGLIHDRLKMNAYGFSVDDAVGFMSELGDGIIFTVGGSVGLENPRQFKYEDGFQVLVGVPQVLAGKESQPLIKKYGACTIGQYTNDPDCQKDFQNVTMPANTQIPSFRIGTFDTDSSVRVRFTDYKDNVYSFRIDNKFPACQKTGKPCPPIIGDTRRELMSDCRVTAPDGQPHPKSGEWCGSFNPNQNRGGDGMEELKNFASFGVLLD